MGEKFTVTSRIANRGTTPTDRFVAHLNVASLTERVYVDPEDKALVPPADWHPKRSVRTVLSSMAESKDFGRQMAREAKRRREAAHR